MASMTDDRWMSPSDSDQDGALSFTGTIPVCEKKGDYLNYVTRVYKTIQRLFCHHIQKEEDFSAFTSFLSLHPQARVCLAHVLPVNQLVAYFSNSKTGSLKHDLSPTLQQYMSAKTDDVSVSDAITKQFFEWRCRHRTYESLDRPFDQFIYWYVTSLRETHQLGALSHLSLDKAFYLYVFCSPALSEREVVELAFVFFPQRIRPLLTSLPASCWTPLFPCLQEQEGIEVQRQMQRHPTPTGEDDRTEEVYTYRVAPLSRFCMYSDHLKTIREGTRSLDEKGTKPPPGRGPKGKKQKASHHNTVYQSLRLDDDVTTTGRRYNIHMLPLFTQFCIEHLVREHDAQAREGQQERVLSHSLDKDVLESLWNTNHMTTHMPSVDDLYAHTL